MKYYIASLARCEIVEAYDLSAAYRAGERIFGNRLKVVRPATPDEIELHETWPAETK